MFRKNFQREIGEGSFSYRRDQAKIEAEAGLDGLYVIRSNVSSQTLSDHELVAAAERSAWALERRAVGAVPTATQSIASGTCSANWPPSPRTPSGCRSGPERDVSVVMRNALLSAGTRPGHGPSSV